MGYLLDQMEKVASFAEEAMMEKLALDDSQDEAIARLGHGMAGALGIGAAGGLTAKLPSQLDTLLHGALGPRRDALSGLPLTEKGSDARRFLAQDKSLLRNAANALLSGDQDKATKLMTQYNSPTHRAWRGFKAMSLPGKFKLLAPVLGTAAGVAGLGTAGVYGLDKAINGFDKTTKG